MTDGIALKALQLCLDIFITILKVLPRSGRNWRDPRRALTTDSLMWSLGYKKSKALLGSWVVSEEFFGASLRSEFCRRLLFSFIERVCLFQGKWCHSWRGWAGGSCATGGDEEPYSEWRGTVQFEYHMQMWWLQLLLVVMMKATQWHRERHNTRTYLAEDGQIYTVAQFVINCLQTGTN